MHPYLALQQLLLKINSNVSAATIHGLWCGRLAAGDSLEKKEWWSFTVRVIGSKVAFEDNIVAAFKAVATFANHNLQLENFQFEPWLPAESVACSQRIAALSEWCQGFIEGLTSVLGSQLDSASDDTKEIMRDLLDIGEVDAEVSGTEEDEKQFSELKEYVKVAVLNVWHDFAGKVEAGRTKASGVNPTIH